MDALAKPPTKTPAVAPLALTDDQLHQIMRHAAVLHPQMRRVFIEHVAYELRGQPIGDGEVWRACRQILRGFGRRWKPSAAAFPIPTSPRHGVSASDETE